MIDSWEQCILNSFLFSFNWYIIALFSCSCLSDYTMTHFVLQRSWCYVFMPLPLVSSCRCYTHPCAPVITPQSSSPQTQQLLCLRISHQPWILRLCSKASSGLTSTRWQRSHPVTAQLDWLSFITWQTGTSSKSKQEPVKPPSQTQTNHTDWGRLIL